jgi:cob(I)alamin adenosyltransferase
MVHLSKIYTRTGDGGKTSLVSGERVSKCAPRIEAFGTIDELNSHLGLVRSCASSCAETVLVEETEQVFQVIQNDLFDLGALLAAAPHSAFAASASFRSEATALLEARMDAYQDVLEELTSFVLPGGGELNARVHVARTVCRRAERIVWQLHENEPVPDAVLVYLNRLSDYLFVYARWTSKRLGQPECLWSPQLNDTQESSS